MSIWRDKKSPFYQYSFAIRGHRFRGSTKTTNRREAETIENAAKDKARDTIKRASSASVSLALDDIAAAYWDAIGQYHVASENTDCDVARIVEFFGPQTLLSDIGGTDLERLVSWRRGHRVRRKDGNGPLVSNATVNRSTIEVLRKLFTFAKRRDPGLRLEREPHWPNSCSRNPTSGCANCMTTRPTGSMPPCATITSHIFPTWRQPACAAMRGFCYVGIRSIGARGKSE